MVKAARWSCPTPVCSPCPARPTGSPPRLPPRAARPGRHPAQQPTNGRREDRRSGGFAAAPPALFRSATVGDFVLRERYSVTGWPLPEPPPARGPRSTAPAPPFGSRASPWGARRGQRPGVRSNAAGSIDRERPDGGAAVRPANRERAACIWGDAGPTTRLRAPPAERSRALGGREPTEVAGEMMDELGWTQAATTDDGPVFPFEHRAPTALSGKRRRSAIFATRCHRPCTTFPYPGETDEMGIGRPASDRGSKRLYHAAGQEIGRGRGRRQNARFR